MEAPTIDYIEHTTDYFDTVSEEIEEGEETDLAYYGSEFYVMPDTTVPVTNSSESIRWVYTIDIDRMCFSVNNGAHFRLRNLPRGGANSKNWIKYLALDGMGTRCTDPCTPAEFVADLYPLKIKPARNGLKAWRITGRRQSFSPSINSMKRPPKIRHVRMTSLW